MEYVKYLPYAIAAASLIFNIIQFITRRREIRALRGLVQGDYNVYFHIARQCGRIRQENLDSTSKSEEAISAIEVIRGCADATRNQLIAFSREHLDFLPFYEHPAEPGKKQPDQIKFGTPPDKYRFSKKKAGKK